MAKVIKQEVRLVDESGREWARAILSPASVKRLIREYKRFDIWLSEEVI